MDRSDYRRILGVGEDATREEIKRAYENRIARLKTADYDDEPEYAARKAAMAREAYQVLTGESPLGTILTGKNKRSKEECLHDGERVSHNRENSSKKSIRYTKDGSDLISIGTEKINQAVRKARDAGGKDPKNVIKVVIAGVIIFNLALSLIGGLASCEPDSVWDSVEVENYENTYSNIDALNDGSVSFDYYGHLSEPIEEISDKVEPVEDIISGENSQDIWGDMTDLAYALGIEYNSEGIGYITGDEDYYYNNDDLTNTKILIQLMGAPDYEDVAGRISDYSGEAILDYNGYLRFLQDVAEDQFSPVRT